MKSVSRRFNLVVVGAGPGGLAPLLAAHRQGRLDDLLAAGVAIVERSPSIGGGTIGGYAINSDSSGNTFVDCLKAPGRTRLTELAEHPLARAMAAAGEGAVALRDAGRFLDLVGATLGEMVAAHPACAVLTRHEALSGAQASVQPRAGAPGCVARGEWRVAVRDPEGRERTLIARHVVLATGARQPAPRLAAERVGGENLLARVGARLLQSGDVLSTGGLEQVTARLAVHPSPRVAVVGGSTSAAAVCHALLHRMPGVRFAPGAITLLHRRPLRIYYPDVASARAEGYTEFTDDDLCPISGRVFRFAGFRLDSREMVMQARGIGGRAPEPRLALHMLREPADPEAWRILDQADLVVAAMGYRPNALPVLDRAGVAIALLAQGGPQLPLVDGQCRVLDADGAPLAGLFGIGLAAGFVPRGALGGEPSFRGQANGLWLWQNDVGGLIVAAALDPASPASAPSVHALPLFDLPDLVPDLAPDLPLGPAFGPEPEWAAQDGVDHPALATAEGD